MDNAEGTIQLEQQNMPGAVASLQAAATKYLDGGDTVGNIRALASLSICHVICGDSARARTCAEQVSAAINTEDECMYKSVALWVLGFDESTRDTRKASDLLGESLNLSIAIDNLLWSDGVWNHSPGAQYLPRF
ncbi:hypothetical protein [Rhodococcus sp. 27YEA15]|uniref:hypothetical protein n=1 Tax=Rhodococcus sp. 27YEA15 TaxID=3156259 RepID=UPI003C7E4434